MTIRKLKHLIENHPTRSAWTRGVREYALEILEDMNDDYDFVGSPADRKALNNGAKNWDQYSWGGCSFIYDADIAARLCSPSEFKKTRYGERKPNAQEEWLDVQARALFQAANLITRTAKSESICTA